MSLFASQRDTDKANEKEIVLATNREYFIQKNVGYAATVQ